MLYAKKWNRGRARWENFYVNPKGRGMGLGAGVQPGIHDGRASGGGGMRRSLPGYANYVYGGRGFGNSGGHVHEIWTVGWR